MPLVLIKANQKIAERHNLSNFSVFLQRAVATILSSNEPGGELKPEHVEINRRDRSPTDVGGEQYDLSIIIMANEYPKRRENLDERALDLAGMVQGYFTGHDVHAYVWIRLAPGAFSEF